ncbi:MAG: AAA family ATPase [Chitinivibrionales bacterium]|nr:AAA family ATPase [Chitinivibrionales bacterium]MBD3357933.1 AAA family ATPase [Chitinivibrionales bacterium]
MSYLEHWSLREKPFEELCDTRFFFESDDHREALDRLLYVVHDRNMNMGLLTGEVGSGKTITKNVFLSSLSHHDFEVIGFENVHFPFTDILYDIIKRVAFRDIRAESTDGLLPPRGDRYLLISRFKEMVDTLVFAEKRHLVLVFDEAQQMSAETIDAIKSLTNISSETINYMTIFLVGQPELREKIRALPQVNQRIFLRFHLNNLDYDNTVKYIQHRLRVAGLTERSIFSGPAHEYIFRTTGGVPREINRLCKLALTFAFAHELPEVSREDLKVILEDLEKHS